MERELVTWETPPHEHKPRSVDWYWALGIFAVSAAALAVIFSDYLFAVVILLAAFSIGIYSSREPKLSHIELSDRGIRIDGKRYQYDTLRSFWVDHGEDSGRRQLLITSQKFLMPQIVIPIPEDVLPDRVRALLSKYLAEEEQHESLAQRVAELFGL